MSKILIGNNKKYFRKGIYYDIELRENNIYISKNNKEILTLPVTRDLRENFKNRKKLKAVLVDDNKGVLQIVRFADLHRHSGYSLLDGAVKPKDMAKKTEFVGAITDHGNMFGTLEYYKAMKELGKHPIIGSEIYMRGINGEKGNYHAILLVKNQIGYKNLCKIITKAQEDFYRHPLVSYKLLEKHSEGLIFMTACLGGEIPKKIIEKKDKEVEEILERLIEIFGTEDLYLEIQNHGIKEEKTVANELYNLSKKYGLKLVATTDSHYLDKNDKLAHEILLCLQTKKTINDPDRMVFNGEGYHIHTAEEFEERFKEYPEAIDNTLEIAEKCSFDFDLKNLHFPKCDVPKEYTQDEYFEKLCWEGFEKRFRGTEKYNNPKYKERLKYEINTIKDMGYTGYFIIVWDFIKFAKDNGIMVGPGRGSAVGSLVAYCLEITNLDPIPHGLLFERFLNPERISMPDIDTDFEDERREEVINYVIEKYGEKNVSNIVTFGTLGARMVVRDVARVLEFPYSIGDEIAKAIPKKPGITIEEALEESPELKIMYETEDTVKKIIDIAIKLEGLPRHKSQHACGILILPDEVSKFVPEVMTEDRQTKEKSLSAGFDMVELEELGLLKMDFLGLRTLNVLSESIRLVNKKRKEKGLSEISVEDIPITDTNVYKFISTGKTNALFQIEGQGMKNLMKEIFYDVDEKINKIKNKYKGKEKEKKLEELGWEFYERLVAAISLFRPGPIDEIPKYLENMKNPENIEYDVPELEPILKNTYGVIVYQEQVMQIVQKLAGYSLGRADLVRRAMGKKKLEIMAKEKEYFINGKLNEDGTVDVPGCIRNGIPKEKAEIIWNKMADFAKYAFNKSHSAGYTVITVKTAWLKHYYPVEFMVATLNSIIDDNEKLAIYLEECKDMGIKVLPPDVNKSKEKFSIENNSIRYGFMGIKNIGKIARYIIIEREQNGDFTSYQDFVERIAISHKVDKRMLEALIYSSALDSFEGTRRAKIEVLEEILKSAKIEKGNNETGQIDIFSLNEDFAKFKKIEIPDIEEYNKKEKLLKEKEYAGVYITEHPLDEYEKYLKKKDIHDIAFLISDEEDGEEDIVETYNYNGKRVKVVGIIKDIKIFYTRTGKILKTFIIEDKTGELKCVIFQEQIKYYNDLIQENNIVILSGEIKVDNFGMQLVVDRVLGIEFLSRDTTPTSLIINTLNKKEVNSVKNIADKLEKGNTVIYVKFRNKRYRYQRKIKLDYKSMSSFLNNYDIEVEYK